MDQRISKACSKMIRNLTWICRIVLKNYFIITMQLKMSCKNEEYDGSTGDRNMDQFNYERGCKAFDDG